MRIIDFFDQGVNYYPDNLAFIDADDNDAKVTYAEASIQTHHIASALRGHGFVKGTVIGVYGPNSNVAFIALLGLMRAGNVWLPINPRNSVDTNIDLSDRFGMEVVFYHSSYAEQTEELLEAVPNVKVAVCIDSDDAPIGVALKDWITGYQQDFPYEAEEKDELAAIYPTGGTTGKSKGVLMNHKAIETMFNNFYSHFNYYENTVHFVVAPMTHSAGLFGAMHFARGGVNVMMDKADPLLIMKAVEKYNVSHMFLPPTVLYMMLSHEELDNYNYSSLQHFIVGAAPTSLEKLKEAVKKFGPVMTEAYGQSECPASISLKAPWDYMNKDGSINEERLRGIGRPAVFNRVKIMDENDNEVPRGTPGEICVQGDLVTLGYYKNPKATAEAHKNGWLHTGDVAVMDENGYLRIVDRSKDLIITGGFNVYPNEVEQTLMEHPAVHEASVIGIPDEKWGEAVKGVVQLRPGVDVTAEELIALTKDKLGGVKCPKSIDFVDALPKSPAGKVLKTEIRKKYWQGQDRLVN